MTRQSLTENSGSRPGAGGRSRTAGFSLIEIIGVLAIVAILAAVILPVLLRQLDYAAQTAETTALQTLANGLQQGCLRQRHLPGPGNWASFIATNAGCQTAAVLTNGRKNLRVLLIDPALVVGSATADTLPYQQPAAGSTNLPVNPRFLLVSSLSHPLPSGLSAAADFNSLWATPDDTVPATATWTNWAGRGADLRVQRINLASSFQRLLLNNYEATNAFYSIDNFAPVSLTATQRVDAYYLAGTRFRLFQKSGTNVAQASQVLAQDTSWVFSAGYWRNANVAVAPATNFRNGGWENIIETFLNNPANPWTGTAPPTIYSNMTNFMALYNAYAAGGFTSDALKSQLSVAKTTLMDNYMSIDVHP
jgi:prepilin-type N-terminal cleavage/methylation domain-containing protein